MFRERIIVSQARKKFLQNAKHNQTPNDGTISGVQVKLWEAITDGIT